MNVGADANTMLVSQLMRLAGQSAHPAAGWSFPGADVYVVTAKAGRPVRLMFELFLHRCGPVAPAAQSEAAWISRVLEVLPNLTTLDENLSPGAVAMRRHAELHALLCESPAAALLDRLLTDLAGDVSPRVRATVLAVLGREVTAQDGPDWTERTGQWLDAFTLDRCGWVADTDVVTAWAQQLLAGAAYTPGPGPEPETLEAATVMPYLRKMEAQAAAATRRHARLLYELWRDGVMSESQCAKSLAVDLVTMRALLDEFAHQAGFGMRSEAQDWAEEQQQKRGAARGAGQDVEELRLQVDRHARLLYELWRDGVMSEQRCAESLGVSREEMAALLNMLSIEEDQRAPAATPAETEHQAAARFVFTTGWKSFLTPKAGDQRFWAVAAGGMHDGRQMMRGDAGLELFIPGRRAISLRLHVEAHACPACTGSGHRDAVTTAALDVLAERARQVTAEGWTPEHDDEHAHGEMATAAACYAMMGRYHFPTPGMPPDVWPWAAGWWKPAGFRRNLVKAGALVLAEIERLDRAARRAG